MAKLHPERRPTPKSKGVLDRPVLGLGLELQVKAPEELGKNETHLGIGQASGRNGMS
jgi:hypothetical protein